MIRGLCEAILISLVAVNISFAADIHSGESDQELLISYTQHWIGNNPVSQKYIYDVIYIGMPQDDFEKIFIRKEEFEGTMKPYIVKKNNDVYYLYEPGFDFMKKKLRSNLANTGKSRIKFEDSRLVKYEVQYWGKPPFVYLVYSDATHNLKGFVKEDTGFYDGMAEEDFLKVFSGKILSHKKDKYVFWGKDGRKYRVVFYEGYLIGRERL